MRLLPLIVALLASFSLARADTPSVEFDGQRYTLNFEEQGTQPDGQSGDAIAEFTLAGETVENWSKLFAYHAYPSMGDDPVAAVQVVGNAVKENNKDANFAIIGNEEKGVAIIDFLTWEPESDIMEFNVFKYSRAGLQPGLIALQFAQRFKLGTYSVEAFRRLRERAVENMAATDVTQARAYFAAKAKETGIAGPAASARAGIDR